MEGLDNVEWATYELPNIPIYDTKLPKNMIDVLKGLSKPICDGKDGLKTLEILIAAYKSAKENRLIKFPLDL